MVEHASDVGTGSAASASVCVSAVPQFQATRAASASCAPVASAALVPEVGRKKFGIQVVMPEGSERQPVCGVILIDSFSYLVDRSTGWVEDYYVPRLLKHIWEVFQTT